MTSEHLAPGWKPDPEVANQQRYWDGTAWTDDVAPAAAVVPAATAAPARVTQFQTQDEKSVGLAIFFNFLWAGAGQLYAGVNTGLGITLMILEGVNIVLTMVFGFLFLVGFCFGVLVWAALFLWASIDVNSALKQRRSVYIVQ